VLAAATLPEVAAAADVPLAVVGGVVAAQYGVKEVDEALFGSSSASAPFAPTFNTVSCGYRWIPHKASSTWRRINRVPLDQNHFLDRF
jgi:hypothetical protein